MIDDREDVKRAAIVRLVMHRIHAPALIRARGLLRFAAHLGNAFGRLTFMRSCRPSRRYRRYTRVFPTGLPSRLSITSTLR